MSENILKALIEYYQSLYGNFAQEIIENNFKNYIENWKYKKFKIKIDNYCYLLLFICNFKIRNDF
jgi:hypothetical protein